MPSPIRSIFSSRTFYRAERTRLNKAWRELIREAVLLYPSCSAASLRSMVMQRAVLKPLHGICILNMQPGSRAELNHEHSLEPVYRNLAWLGFCGDGRLFKAQGRNHGLFLRPALVEAGSAALVYHSVLNSSHGTRDLAERDLPEIRHAAESQLPGVEAHNRWLERALDRALESYAEHIKLWREEGELDWARARKAA